MLFSASKFPLTAEAMKIVAKTLTFPDDLGGSPRAAVMAGMRNDSPRTGYCAIIMPPQPGSTQKDPSCGLIKPVIFVSGDIGVGKTELLQTWMRLAAEDGYRSLFLCRKIIQNWDDQDVVSLDGPASADEIEGIVAKARDALLRADVSHIHASMVPYADRQDLFRLLVHKTVREIIDNRRQDFVFAIDDMDWSQDQELLREICDYANVTPSFRFFTTSLITADLPAENFVLKPTELLMRTVRKDQMMAGELDRSLLGKGCFYQNKDSDGVYRTYTRSRSGLHTPTRLREPVRKVTSCLPPPALLAIKRLESALRIHPHSTHTERLEMVARACGYRSWHAAQGKKESLLPLCSLLER